MPAEYLGDDLFAEEQPLGDRGDDPGRRSVGVAAAEDAIAKAERLGEPDREYARAERMLHGLAAGEIGGNR